MFKGQHQLPDFVAVLLVYGIIFSEYYAFVFIFLPAFLNKHGSITYLIGIEFTIIFLFLNLAYIMIQYTKPGYPPKDLVFVLVIDQAKHYHERTLEDIKQRTKKMTEKINKHRQRRMQNHIEMHDEHDDEIVIKQFYYMVLAILFKHYNQFHTALNVIIQNYPELTIVKNAINDHHCPWVNNCVGLKNHRYFCQFNFYALLCMIQCTLFISYDLFVNDRLVLQELTKNQQFILTICDVTCLSLVLVMGFLLGFHIYHIAQNITTVEYHINEIKANNPFRKPRIIDNFKEVFGPEIKYWFLPLGNVEKSAFPRTDLFEV